MRRLTLKTVNLDPEHKLDWKDQILAIMRNHPEGASVEEIRKAIRVIDAVEAAAPGGELQLEDADWEYLDQKVQRTKFSYAHSAVIEFVEDVAKAQGRPAARASAAVD